MNKKEVSEECFRILKEGIDKVEEKYFDFAIVGKDKDVSTMYRERVYCYEIYHQVRILQDNEDSLIKENVDINCEPDKRGNTWFKKSVNPDMIFHKAGNIYENYLVLEVKNSLTGRIKGPNGNPTGIYKDIINLYHFIKDSNYEMACFYLYGHKVDKIKKAIPKRFKKIQTNYIKNEEEMKILEQIKILVKSKYDEKVKEYSLKEDNEKQTYTLIEQGINIKRQP